MNVQLSEHPAPSVGSVHVLTSPRASFITYTSSNKKQTIIDVFTCRKWTVLGLQETRNAVPVAPLQAGKTAKLRGGKKRTVTSVDSS